jgi:hypothetical protein
MTTKSAKKSTKPPPKRAATKPISALDEAIEVRDMVKRRMDRIDDDDPALAKYVDAYSRAANVVRQLEKDQKRALGLFSDDEIIEYLRGLPERRRDAIVTAVQGASLAGKPLF